MNVYYDVCALVTIITLLLSSLLKKSLRGRTNQIFNFLMLVLFSSILFKVVLQLFLYFFDYSPAVMFFSYTAAYILSDIKESCFSCGNRLFIFLSGCL